MTFDYDDARRILRQARAAAADPGADRSSAVDELLALDDAIGARLATLHERGEVITRTIRESPDEAVLEVLEEEIVRRDIELVMLQELATEVAEIAAAFRPPADLGPVH